MVRVCAFPGCGKKMKHYNPESFHRLPLLHSDTLKQWLVILHIDVETPVKLLREKDYRVCSNHFKKDDFVVTRRTSNPPKKHNLKKGAVPRAERPVADHVNEDVDWFESSVYLNDGSSSESLDSVSINRDQPLPDKHLSEEKSGPTQESDLSLTLLCYSEPDSDQEDESTEQTTTESHDVVCNVEEQQQILQTRLKRSSVKLKNCRNRSMIKTEATEEEYDTDDDEDDDEEDKHKRYDDDDDDDFVPSDELDDDDDHYIPSDENNESSDEEKTHKCRYYKKIFSDKSQLRRHVRSHSNEKPYQCSVCGKTFKGLSSMRSHEKIHSEEKPFSCSHCDKRFSHNYDLKKHERVHTGEKPFLCQHCGKSFSNSSNFTLHQRIHTGEKPYQCSQCGKRFARCAAYKLHQRVHTGVKPYQCSFCGKCFTRQDNLVTHQRIHTGEKPYKCTQCDLGFTQAVLLRLHQKKHTGGKP